MKGGSKYRYTPPVGRRRPTKNNTKMTPKEGRRLAQLLVAVAIFAGVSLADHFFPHSVATLRSQAQRILQQDTDFVSAFAATGEAMFHQEPVLETLGTLWVDVMGSTQEERGDDYLDLGLENTVTPVVGTLTSPFGVRTHPVDGTETFHTGVDIAAVEGTEILAFAQGTVTEVGENDIHGRHLTLDHGNGVTSFYAHCDSTLVEEGQVVHVGKPIATVGQTGQSTGPHLHFELCYQEQNLNPIYYITVATDGA